jgi:EAL domain-containing protein (putative c-di-GMP-specific phosphodiesterase class I)
VDVLKIDKSFIEDIDASDRGASIVTGIIALAHKLGFTVVAEGVETDRQRRFLAEQECDQLQGFLVSRPLPPEQFFSFVSGWTADWSTSPR